MIILKILMLILLTDFITGFVHFLLDQYGSPEGRFFKNAVKINLAHHDNPRLMIDRSYWDLTKDSYKLGVILLAITSLIFGFHWEILFVLILGANTNIFHKWSHMKKSERPMFITFLQKLKVLQHSKHHREHHKKPFDTYFCIITNVLNPILEKVYFWEGVIWSLKLIGVKPVAGTEVRGYK